jgi:serine/threonine protein kinase
MMHESPSARSDRSDPSSSGGLGRTRKPRVKRTLATVLRERGTLSMQHAVEVALDICDALSVAHANGVIHGELGLGCVRLAFTADGGPRDVEIFTLTADAEDSLAVPVAPFLEPERAGAGGVRRVDARSDVWALGALLYTMLAGTSPPARDDATELVLDGAPRSLVSVIEACLAHEPERRPHSVEDVAERIASYATWPPDQFARIGARREKRAAAERVQRQLERRGLGNLPSVLDKLDDAALARAQRPATETLSSLLHQNVRKSTEAAMQRLMTAVHEGTDEARVELAARLPALVRTFWCGRRSSRIRRTARTSGARSPPSSRRSRRSPSCSTSRSSRHRRPPA